MVRWHSRIFWSIEFSKRCSNKEILCNAGVLPSLMAINKAHSWHESKKQDKCWQILGYCDGRLKFRRIFAINMDGWTCHLTSRRERIRLIHASDTAGDDIAGQPNGSLLVCRDADSAPSPRVRRCVPDFIGVSMA